MKHYGDITKISGYEVPVVDIITGGSPCQDLSVAGKRAGLSGERSGLFMEQLRIVKEMREKEKESGKTANSIRPRYMVWENVPGAFSSNKGEDFQAVLTEIVRIVSPNCPDVPLPKKWAKSGCLMGYGENGQPFSVAYRLHDAQFWGVPQRRKRIALVADFNGITAPEILFEREGLSRDSSESEGEKQGTTTDVKGSIGTAISFQERGGRPGGGKGILIQNEHIGAMKTNQNQYVCSKPIGFNRGCGSGLSMAEEKEPTIQAAAGESGNNQPLVCHSVYTTQACGDRDNPSQSFIEEKAYTLPSNPMSDRGQAVCQPILLESNQNHATIQTDGVSTTLPASMGMGGGYVPMVCKEEIITTSHGGYMINADDSNIAHTLQATDYKDAQCVCIGNGQVNDSVSMSVEVSKTLNCMKDTMKIVTYGVDMYNQSQSEEVAKTLNSIRSESDHVPCVYGQSSFANYEEKVSTLKAAGGDIGGGSENLCVSSSIVRRLTPLECERLQGFPTIRKVRFTEMTKDEYIAWNLAEKNIIVDQENGKVYATRGPGGIKLKEPRELEGSNIKGYLVVSIRNGDTKMQCKIHRIVWISAHGIIPEGYVIDHINNNKSDNRLCNLQILTPGENSTKAKEDGLYLIHDENPAAKITNEVHDLIQYVYGNSELSLRDLSDIFGISKSRVGQIIYEEPWTDIGDWVDSNGKKHKGDADAPRYKALGNSIALPYWKWLAERMCKYLDKPTMASLFDGIGGFALVYKESGCEPVWASEVEDFCIAVTKKRFGEE